MKDTSRLAAAGCRLADGSESLPVPVPVPVPDCHPSSSASRKPQAASRSESEFEISPDDLPPHESPRERWSRVFGAHRPLRIEIGVGNSSFLIQVALGDPGFNYLGFEYSPKRVARVLKKVESSGAQSIRILRLNAVRVLPELVAPESVDRFFINFPDPWPKRKHAKHRLIQPPTAACLARLLRGGGGISLRTDAPAYAAQMISVLDRVPDLINLAGAGRFAAGPREEIRTPYELKYRAEGRSINYLEYRKRTDAEGSTISRDAP